MLQCTIHCRLPQCNSLSYASAINRPHHQNRNEDVEDLDDINDDDVDARNDEKDDFNCLSVSN